mmetsp:Transcript_6150/g.13496  ORF Transcript_6150/g.13496 Transcript_6150/m.13496 type:complete len:210 (+) Transcript_6150:272-901(+)
MIRRRRKRKRMLPPEVARVATMKETARQMTGTVTMEVKPIIIVAAIAAVPTMPPPATTISLPPQTPAGGWEWWNEKPTAATITTTTAITAAIITTTMTTTAAPTASADAVSAAIVPIVPATHRHPPHRTITAFETSSAPRSSDSPSATPDDCSRRYWSRTRSSRRTTSKRSTPWRGTTRCRSITITISRIIITGMEEIWTYRPCKNGWS